LIDDVFNRGGRSTSRETTRTHSVGIVTINLDRLKKLFSNYKEASRVELIPFEPSTVITDNVDDADLIIAQKQAGPAVHLFIKLERVYEEEILD
jgi:hypothetical protein